ncbi:MULTISPECIES: hypothetical protein [Metasolibacillus]|uniref:hypothetical protein n=1 Tax=Metasolibacillus TaxID=2703677 RepID=UPI000D3C6BA3|nr:hypothetical protein [Metasolibacillus fluoroglycofenilyticus]
MKSFIALLQKEWLVVRGNILFLFVIGLLLIFGVPYIINKNAETSITIGELVMIFLVFSVLLGTIASPVQFVTSLRTDVNRKEIWLHSPQSIYKLVGAKALFSICLFIVFTFVVLCSAFIIISTQLEWTLLKALIASIVMTIGLTCLQLLILTYTQVFYTFYLQLKRYIGKFSMAVTVPLAIFVGFLLTKIENSTLYRAILQKGYISLESLENYLQPSNQSVFFYVGSIYIVQILFYACCVIILFILSSKWLEKVVSQS